MPMYTRPQHWLTVPAGVVIIIAAAGTLPSSRPRAGVSDPAAQPPAAAAAQAPAAKPADVSRRVVLNKYCVTCHNDRLKTGSLSLERIDAEQIADNAATWEKVVLKVKTGAMPPAGRPRLDADTVATFVSSLESSLDQAAAAHPNPGSPTVHRLNRSEYVNVIRDVLALKIDGAALLPPDSSGFGFDNIADVLRVSPGLLDRYLIAAQTISRLAVGDPTIRPVIETYKQLELLRQEDRVSEDLPFGTRGGVATNHNFPVDGEYTIKVVLQKTIENSVVRGAGESNDLEIYLDGALLKHFTIYCPSTGRGGGVNTCAQSADAHLEVRVPVAAGPHLVGTAFVKHASVKEGLDPDRVPIVSFAYAFGQNTQAAVESIEIAGPYDVTGPGNSPSRRRIFVCHPSSAQDEGRCAKTILSTIARRAYRRPITESDLQPLISFYEKGRRERGFDAGIQAALEVILVSPDLLFRVEDEEGNVPRTGVYRISDIDLASQLSFFLWSSVPDDALLDAAVRGRLHNPAVLAQQIKRMLADDRADALVGNFGSQWLYLRNLTTVAPDTGEYPDFDDNLRVAFQRETELFLSSQIREDRPIIEMLDANYSYLNERLAEFYGIPNVYGSHFRRVKLPGDRRGLLGQASILTATSYGNRTSPVLRGKWILENVLGAPPPPPPANVPPLPEDQNGATPQTMRERMEEHRKNPVCASCHARIDPLGFALENFDAEGHWRTNEGGKKIDASGVLVDGSKFDGAAELRATLMHHQDEFVATVTKKLLTYALGRGVEYSDMPAVRRILRDAAPSKYSWAAIVMGIASSEPFQMRSPRR
jgi:mono/diheme cytochrome c family protein